MGNDVVAGGASSETWPGRSRTRLVCAANAHPATGRLQPHGLGLLISSFFFFFFGWENATRLGD